jgi:16S rRNA processing protein RimM
MSSTRETTELPLERVLVGRVLRPHGLRGAVLVENLSDNSRRYASGAELLLRREGPETAPVRVVESRANPHGLVVRLAGVESREGAEALRGAWLEVERDQVPEPPAGSYWVFELVGSRCVDVRHGDLGVLEDLVDDGGGTVLRIVRPGAELLVPFVDRFVAGIDRQERVVRLELPEGLVEACTSRS